ncbi:ester cyclase [Chitinophagaceae bacterium LB-8]|uniref:Ester cyclase n=1 Tax=Paraflavisolibacter caeni TaxID=2982496 RepID=A0A9X3BGH4_9BACT|nr:ester cyclase [Paraflavisolibacter caeni]MCU7550914.1 ester cyclase [Paraflavisolibacter caeni]
MSNKNTTLCHRWFEQVWNQGREQAIDEMFDTNGIAHGITDENSPKGVEGFKSFYKDFRTQFSNIHITLDDVVCEEDIETARCTVNATHTDSGKDVNFKGISMVRVKDGKIIEAWNHFDFLDLYQQLGHTLLPPQA